MLLTALAPAVGAAQPTLPLPRTVAARVRLVENSLQPYVPVEGLPGWNLRERMKLYRVPGLSIAVIHNYRVEWARAYGWADTTARTPVTPATLFSAGSISKLVTAGAALALVQQGKLALDAPINTYLKSWQLGENDLTRQRPVTLRLLLSHQGGTSQSSYWGFVPGAKPRPSVVDILSGQPAAETRPVVVNRLPGTGFQYSGGGYLVAQLALTDAAGQDFTTLTNDLLFRPLTMRTANFLPSPCRPCCNPAPPGPTPKTAGSRACPTCIRSRPRPASTPRPATWPASLSKCSRPTAAGARCSRKVRRRPCSRRKR